MPVSHIGLTVSHLPSALSFYLSVLQPLGYRVVREDAYQVGLGAGEEAELFICQDPSGGRPSGTHVAFTAATPEQVDAVYSAAMRAGARSYAPPSFKSHEANDYSAAVIDMDNNAIEVTAGNFVPVRRGSEGQPVSETRDSSSVLKRIPLRSIVNNIGSLSLEPSEPAAKEKRSSGSSALVGTLLGAAAGAVIAYAMAKSDSPSHTTHSHSHTHTHKHEVPRNIESRPQRQHSESPPRPVRRVTVREWTEYASRRPPLSSCPSTVSHHASEPRLRQYAAIEAPMSRNTSTDGSRTTVRALPAPPAAPSPPPAPANFSVYSASSVREPSPTPVASRAGTHRTHESRHTGSHHTGSHAHTVGDYDARSTRSSRARPALPEPRRSHTAGSLHTWEVPLPPSAPGSRYTEEPPSEPIEASWHWPGSARGSERRASLDHSRHSGSDRRRSLDYSRHSASERRSSLDHTRHSAAPGSGHSRRSWLSRHPRDVPLPDSSAGGASSYASAREQPQPGSARSSLFSRRPREAHEVPLPASARTSIFSRKSREAHETPLPASIADGSSLASARDVPLPASARTSFLSRRPSLPRSAGSASTVRPHRHRKRRAAATDNGVDDLDSIVPDDSISQVGDSSSRRRRGSRKSAAGSSSSGRSGADALPTNHSAGRRSSAAGKARSRRASGVAKAHSTAGSRFGSRLADRFLGESAPMTVLGIKG